MAIYVVDSSVIIDYLVAGPYTLHSIALFNSFSITSDNDALIVPEFCLVECTNVIWKNVRFQGLDVGEAQRIHRYLRRLPLKRVPVKAVLNQSLKIGLLHQLAIYDSVFIALTQRTGCPLITLDQKQARAAMVEGLEVIPLTRFN